MSIELVPLCTVRAVTRPALVVGEGPAGRRSIIEVASVRVEGERLRGGAEGGPAGDWVLMGPGDVGTVDVRFAFETDDGAVVFVQYGGRLDASVPRADWEIRVAPRFETADPRYAWLNMVQAVGKGRITPDGVTYEWFEVR